MSRRERPPAELVNHRVLAARLGVKTELVRLWIERKRVPRPHAAVGTLYFYRASDVDYFLRHGRWPDGMTR